jgi:hypothetical protein
MAVAGARDVTIRELDAGDLSTTSFLLGYF